MMRQNAQGKPLCGFAFCAKVNELNSFTIIYNT